MDITVLGCGRWGTFIAWYLERINHNVILWGRNSSSNLKNLITNRKNDFLSLPNSINITDNLELAIKSSNIIVISISAQNLRDFMKDIIKYNLSNKTLVLCMKGIEASSGKRLSQVVTEYIDTSLTKVAIWVGPGHVQDFINDIPNCMVIDSEDFNTKNMLVNQFSSKMIRFYYGTDLIGNEIGAAAKNVIGIAAGMLDGIELSSLKGALMSRGTREISRLIKAMGGNEFSAYGLCHLGDYQATLFSEHSQNRKFGECIVTRKEYSKLAEGASTTLALIKLGQIHNTDLPICKAVNDVIYNNVDAKLAIDSLFLRSIKHEF